MAVSAGTVFLDVLPDTRLFARQLIGQVVGSAREVERRALIPVRPDGKQFTQALKGEIVRVRRHAVVPVQADTRVFERQVTSGAKRVAGRAAAALAGLGVGRAAIGFMREAVTAASDLGEQTSKTKVVFKGAADEVLSFAKTSATALGVSERAALTAAGTFGNLFRAMGIGDKASAKMSTRLVGLAGDLASFNNASPEDALDALKSALIGEFDPIQRFGANLTAARVEAEAFSLGLAKPTKNAAKIATAQVQVEQATRRYNAALKEHGKSSLAARTASAALGTAQDRLKTAMGGQKVELTAAQKAQAAYAIVLKDTKLAQGDFGRTSGSLANQQRILGAQWDNLKSTLGQALLPTVTAFVTTLNTELLPVIQRLAEKYGPSLDKASSDLAKTISTELVPTLKEHAGPALEHIKQIVADLGPALTEARKEVPDFSTTFGATGKILGVVATHIDTLVDLLPLLAAGYGVVKVAQLAANVASVANVPLKAAEVATNYLLAKSNRALIASRGEAAAAVGAETVATTASNAAKGVGVLTTVRQTAASVAHRAATIATSIATKAAAAGQWLLNAALTANPIGLVIVAVVALVAAIVIAYKKSETFRKVVQAAWEGIKTATGVLIRAVVAGFQVMLNVWTTVITSILRTAAKVASALGMDGVADKLNSAATSVDGFKDKVNRSLAKITDRTVKVSAEAFLKAHPNSIGEIDGRPILGPPARRKWMGGPVIGGGTRTSDSNLFRLSQHEFVEPAMSVDYYGQGLFEALRQRAIPREAIPGLAAGGPTNLDFRVQERGLPEFNQRIGEFVSSAGRLLAGLVRKAGAGGIGGPAIRHALAWARAQVGAPYIWGGVGPRGWDCSGFMSSIANVIMGRAPYHRLFATSSFPVAGWDKGYSPTGFSIGSRRGHPGHMAGDLGGVHVESRGGAGVVVGPGARGARHPLFGGNIWHLAGRSGAAPGSRELLPGFAHGGVFTRPTLGVLGEGRHHEIASPIPTLREVVREETQTRQVTYDVDNHFYGSRSPNGDMLRALKRLELGRALASA